MQLQHFSHDRLRKTWVLAAIAVSLSIGITRARAQADGELVPPSASSAAPAVVSNQTFEPARIAPAHAPGGALMNHLNWRMQQIQATQEPELRQKRMAEFLNTLKSGMEHIGKNGAAPLPMR